MFSAYNASDGYNGIELTVNLVKAAIITYFDSREDYMQASFQNTYDEGTAADHVHKYAYAVRAGNRKGRVFDASYSVTSLRGHINLSRLTMTKSSKELQDVIYDLKLARGVANAPPLKYFCSDNLNGDGGLWMRHFREDLMSNVRPYVAPSNNFPRLGINEAKIDYLSNLNDMNRVAQSMLRKYGACNRKIIYGLDAEWNRGETGIRLLIISMPNLDGESHDENKVRLFDLNAAQIYDADRFPTNLKALLEKRDFIPAGVHVGGDCSRLGVFGVKMTRWYELTVLGRQLLPNLKSYKMEHLAEALLKSTMNKFGQSGDYSQNPLPMDLQKYAAIDGVVSRYLCEIMLSKLNSTTAVIEPLLEAPIGLTIGATVDLFLRGETVAKVTVTDLPEKNATTKWGSAVVTCSQAIVKVEEVYVQNIHPPFSYRAARNIEGDTNWKKKSMTLQDIYEEGKSMLVNTSSLVVEAVTTSQQTTSKSAESFVASEGTLEQYSSEEDEAMPEEQDNELSQEHLQDEIDPFLIFEGDDYYLDEGDDDLRGRQKHDIFHQFKALPLGKLEPRRSIISRLLIHATFVFDAEDFQKIEQHVQKKKKINPDDDSYLDKLMEDFYFNREWWRQHCRMYTPKALEHAQRLQLVIDSIKADNSLKDLFEDDEMIKYFDSFMDQILKGQFEEPSDVMLFVKLADDNNGLPQYLRLKGTVRAENVHQKMKTAIGPWGIGARTAHMLLVLISYRYNVNTTIKRCDGYDFGHYELHLIDRIQQRIQEIFNVLIWPKYKNVSAAKWKEDFVSVGIGPLNYDERFVQFSPKPAPFMTGDMLFLAERMKLKYPLLPLSTKAEFKILDDYLLNNKPTTSNIEKLAQIYNTKSNGKDIFPKLPSMIKGYLKKHEKNNEIKLANDDVSVGVRELLRRLFITKIDGILTYPALTDTPTRQSTNFEGDIFEDALEQDEDLPDASVAVEDGNTNDFVMEDPDDDDNEEEVAVAQIQMTHHIPPVQAGFQKSYIATISQADRMCANYPRCKRRVSECSGWTLALCKFTSHNRSLDEIDTMEMKLAKNAKRAARRRELRLQRQLQHSSEVVQEGSDEHN